MCCGITNTLLYSRTMRESHYNFTSVLLFCFSPGSGLSENLHMKEAAGEA